MRSAPRLCLLLAALVCALSACGGDERRAAAPTVAPAATADTDALAAEARQQERLEREIRAEKRRQRARAAMRAQSNRDVPRQGSGGGQLGGDFDALEAALGGSSGIAGAGDGGVLTAGSLQEGVAWSTSKVPVVMAALKTGAVSAGSADVRAAITASDNAAAERVWVALGDAATAAQRTDAELRAAGDDTTQTQSQVVAAGFTPFGQTSWALADQARFAAGAACLPEGKQTLELMGQVTSGQRWGLGTLPDARFKGGWGPGAQPGAGGGYFDRQFGLVTVGGRTVAVAIATLPTDGSHETGTANLTRIAAWLAEHPPEGAGSVSC